MLGALRVGRGLPWGGGIRTYTTNKKGATGTWEKTLFNGHQVNSFIPQDLPPKVDLSFSHPMLGITLSESLSEADENLAELKSKTKNLPDSLKSAFLKKEAVASCQVELNARSLADVVKETCGFSHLRKKDERNEVGEVLQYVEAMQLGLRLTGKEPLSVETVETLHRAGTVEKPGQHWSAEIVPGKIRTSQIAVGTAIPPYTNTFFPPPPKHVRRLLDNLMHFMYEPSDMHPILIMGISHVQFETIHPFMHGNGQLGRILLMLRLMQTGLIEKFSLYPSYAFKVVRWMYFNFLQDTRNSGSWETWLHFFVGCISHSARDAIEMCDDFLALQQRQRKAIQGNNRRADIDDAKTNKLLDITYRMPYIQKQTVALLFGEEYSVAHELLDLFTRRGILELVRDERNEIWYHNKAVCDELNKERHIASYASMLGNWMRVPSRAIEINETVEYHFSASGNMHETTKSPLGAPPF
jgi:Fic family protein